MRCSVSVAPLAVGLLDKRALGGMLVGHSSLVCSWLSSWATPAVSGAPRGRLSGGGRFGGRESDAHVVAVGDMVGDPFTDAVGPLLNVLIKLTPVAALALASLLA